jgi:SSS family solute:Na+ symporter
VYSRFLRRDDDKHLASSRWITLALGLAMLLLSCLVNDVIAGLSIAYNLLVGGLLVPILGALLWRRASALGAMVGMLLGCLTVATMMITDGLNANTPIYYGLAVNLLSFVGTSLMTAPAPPLGDSQ